MTEAPGETNVMAFELPATDEPPLSAAVPETAITPEPPSPPPIPPPGRPRSADDEALLQGHYLFDRSLITGQLPPEERAAFEAAPAAHYLRRTGPILRPHALFDPDWYLETYPDVAHGPVHPLIHYIRHGAAERRSPNPIFLPRWYELNLSAEDSAEIEDLLQHYADVGRVRLYSPHPLFAPRWYVDRHADIAQRGADPLAHYLMTGRFENRQPHPLLEREFYLAQANLPKEEWALRHYWTEGMQLGLTPHPVLTVDNSRSDRESPFKPGKPVDRLLAWQRYNQPNFRRQIAVRAAARGLEGKTVFSVIMPVYDPPLRVLQEAIQSVLAQSYPHFQLVIVDDGSKNPVVREELERIAQADERITLRIRPQNGHISVATNDAVALATGSYIVFLDNDDRLAPDALAILAVHLHENGPADLIYSDDARYEGTGRRITGLRFKAGWSPELLLSYSYISHLRVISRKLYKAIGGTRVGFEGSQDHDMFLRVADKTDAVTHIPAVLYERRALPGSTAAGGDEKPYSLDAGLRAVQEAFARRGLEVEVKRPDWAIRANAGVFVPVMPDDGPSVTLIVPTRDNLDKFLRLMRSLPLTTYRNYSVLIIDNESSDPELLGILETLPYRVLRLPSPDGEFSFSALNNQAVAETTSDYVLFLNDDTEVISPHWLSQMMGWARLPGVGVVGARLLLGDGRVQHGGVSPELTVGYTMFRGLPGSDNGYLSYARVTRNCAAVTAACMLTSRDLFTRLGGFDEVDFAVAFNDVDYCLRARDAGLRIVYCGEAELYHHEGSSRPKQDKPSEIAAFRRKYGRRRDPYLNPNLDRRSNRMQIVPHAPVFSRAMLPPRVLFVSHNMALEGAPNSLFEIVSGLLRRNAVRPTVASPVDGPLAALYRALGIEVIIDKRLAAGVRAPSTEAYRSAVAHAAETLRAGDHDVVLCNTAETHWAIRAAALAAVPSIWIIREGQRWNEYFQGVPAETEIAALGSFAQPYRVVFVSRAGLNAWAELDTHANFTLVTNGLNTERFEAAGADLDRAYERRRLGFREEDVVVLCVGTTAARKGQHDLLLALMRLHNDIRCRLQVVFVGARNGTYLERLRAMLESFPKRLRDRVMFITETDSIARYYRIADIFFCGSRVESYPRVILEASSAGLPIITTPISGIPEQVREGMNAFFYEPGHVVDLAERLHQLTMDETLRRAAGAMSTQVLASLTSYEEMLDRYQEMIEEATFSSVPS